MNRRQLGAGIRAAVRASGPAYLTPAYDDPRDGWAFQGDPDAARMASPDVKASTERGLTL